MRLLIDPNDVNDYPMNSGSRNGQAKLTERAVEVGDIVHVDAWGAWGHYVGPAKVIGDAMLATVRVQFKHNRKIRRPCIVRSELTATNGAGNAQ